MNTSKVFFPRNISEVVEILSKEKEIAPFAGGTSILQNLSDRIKLLDLSHLNLSYIKSTNSELRIGSMTSISEIISSNAVGKYCNGIVKDAAKTIASTPNKNLITIGGNIVGVHPWSVFPGLLMLLEGRVLTVKKQLISAEKLFSDVPKNVLNRDIIVEIQFPILKKNVFTYWKKFSLTETDYPIVSVGIICEKEKKLIENIRIVAIGLTLLPQRFKGIEKMLEKKIISDDLIYKVCENIKNEARVNNDIRVSIEYKKEILSVLLKEFLTEMKDK